MKKFLLLLPLIILAGAGCSSSTQVTTPVPVVQNPAPTPTPTSTDMKVMITALKPASGKTGSEVTIVGQGFTQTDNQILFGTSTMHRPDGTPGNVIDSAISVDGKTLTFIVPTSGPSGILCGADGSSCVGIAAMMIQPGAFDVVVTNKNGTSNKVTFTVTK